MRGDAREREGRSDAMGDGVSAFGETSRILAVEVAEPAGGVSADLDQERRIAVFDLVEESRFLLQEPALPGPYSLKLAADATALRLSVTGGPDAATSRTAEIVRPVAALRECVADYVALCADYRDAVRRLAPSQIEKIDEARREAHLEGGEALAAALGDAVAMDAQTARRFFTLICAVLGDEA
ncbi:MAG: UPF0262 family protein [Pseudomonadota bacterium]